MAKFRTDTMRQILFNAFLYHVKERKRYLKLNNITAHEFHDNVLQVLVKLIPYDCNIKNIQLLTEECKKSIIKFAVTAHVKEHKKDFDFTITVQPACSKTNVVVKSELNSSNIVKNNLKNFFTNILNTLVEETYEGIGLEWKRNYTVKTIIVPEIMPKRKSAPIQRGGH